MINGDAVIVTRGSHLHRDQPGILRDCNPLSMRWTVQLGARGPFRYYRAGSFRAATREEWEVVMPGISATFAEERLCEDCPPPDHPTDKTRCLPCPRRRKL